MHKLLLVPEHRQRINLGRHTKYFIASLNLVNNSVEITQSQEIEVNQYCRRLNIAVKSIPSETSGVIFYFNPYSSWLGHKM